MVSRNQKKNLSVLISQIVEGTRSAHAPFLTWPAPKIALGVAGLLLSACKTTPAEPEPVVTPPPVVHPPATASRPYCGPRQALLESLARSHDERPVSLGVTSGGALLEVLASPTGSWTILVTIPGGPTCMVSSGQGWRSAPAGSGGPAV